MEDPTDKARHDQMVTLVERMLELHKQLAGAKTPQVKTVLQRQDQGHRPPNRPPGVRVVRFDRRGN
ncbi:hypothetical protein IH824_04825 [candidate division KSB1 bacterium]|nr:hypothetical protein [candidate division KSB1 bacterium]